MTAGFGRDSQNTSVTLGIAEGFGLSGSFGQGKAASQTSAQSTVQGGLGPISGSLSAGTAGITGSLTASQSMNPGISQTTTHSATLSQEGLTTESTQGFGFGTSVGVAVTHSVTVSISNATLDAVANALGFGSTTNTAPTGPGLGELGVP